MALGWDLFRRSTRRFRESLAWYNAPMPRPRFQFRLRSLFLETAIAAVAGCMLAGAPLIAQEIAAGMPINKAVTILRGIATDLTPGLEIAADTNGRTPKGIYWELKDYDLIVRLYRASDGKVSKLGVWKKKDFNQSKLRRSRMEEPAKRITLDPDNHTFRIEK